ncbi:MAG TPA: NAD(P)H-dependent oxidoreductase [Candidatus Acidoferrum sp.]|nr:NAD(P)H-dependent oxidoreductase [Candidatus Acidoferrum sp.]
MSTVVILASSRSHGNTRTVVDLCFPHGNVALEDLAQLDIGYYSYENGNANDDFLPLMQRLLVHDTWLLATPLYWYTMSAQAKTFLDRFTDLITTRKELGRQLKGKRFGVLCSGTDAVLPAAFAEAFSLTCEYLGMEFIGSHYVRFIDREPANPDARSLAAAFVGKSS